MSPVYFIVLLSVVVYGQIAEDNPKLLYSRDGSCRIAPDPGLAILISAILILVAGLRYRVGTDYNAYYTTELKSWEYIFQSLITMKEPGLHILNQLACAVYDDGASLIFICSLVTIALYCWTIYRYHTDSYMLSMMLFLLLGEWQGTFNGVRQYLAASIVFAGHRYILERKLVKYGIVVVIASLFHFSAIILIVPYFLFMRKPDITQLLLLALGTVVVSLSYSLIFRLIGEAKGKALDTTDAYLSRGIKLPRVLVAFIPVIIYFFLSKKEGLTPPQTLYINASFFNAFSMAAGMGSAYLSRIGAFTGAYLIIGYGYLFQTIEDERSRKTTIFLVVLLYLAYWVYSISAAGIENFRWIFDR